MQIEYSSSEPLYEPGTLDSKKPLKKLEIKDFLSKGTYIDAKDSANNWCVAIILEVFSKEEKVMIRFDGWAEKWNEV